MKRIALISISILSIISCRKDDFDLTQIFIGDYNPMSVTYIDTTLIGGYNSPIEYKIDVDKDGTDDFMFTNVHWGSQGAGIHVQSSIKCLHSNAELYGDLKQRSYFLNLDTSNHFNYYDNTTHGMISHNFTCHRITPADDLINQSSVNTINPIAKNDILKLNDSYFNDNIILADGPIEYWTHNSIVGDTTYHIFNNCYNDCNEFPLDEMTYIGIRLNENRLGWIKIGIYDDDIKILETAITK